MTSFYLSKPYEPPTPPTPLPIKEPWALLGGISPTAFMEGYWHKNPLLVRGAIPAFTLAKAAGEPLESPISAKALYALASQENCESRFIQSQPWRLSQGPFSSKALPPITQPNWTLLLQGVDGLHPAAKTVLSWFRFIPDARLDDLMISIAGPGGGVGPHYDSYDVFLIQMSGRRHWKIAAQSDLSLKPDLPLKILKNFKAADEWVLEPGDMLYLPPHIAHEGISLDPGCQTWSVGFRAATYRELIQEGLWRLAESLENDSALNAHYEDPHQKATHMPDVLPSELTKQIQSRIKKLKLGSVDKLLSGITAYLSEPKPNAIFCGPDLPLSPAAFAAHLKIRGIKLHPLTRTIRLGNAVFCNGENQTNGQRLAVQLCWNVLSERQSLPPLGSQNIKKLDLISRGDNTLYEAYLSGWLILA